MNDINNIKKDELEDQEGEIDPETRVFLDAMQKKLQEDDLSADRLLSEIDISLDDVERGVPIIDEAIQNDVKEGLQGIVQAAQDIKIPAGE